jgi:hypothetical protein
MMKNPKELINFFSSLDMAFFCPKRGSEKSCNRLVTAVDFNKRL